MQARLTTEQRIYAVKTFYQTDNKSETCRLFNNEYGRTVKRDTVSDIVKRFEETGTVNEMPRSGRQKLVTSPQNKETIQQPY